jgi:putative ABC transport system ATP-binding protein
MTESSDWVLEATEVSRRYPGAETGVNALRGVSLRLARGDFLALMGPSGCGKSTLLQLCGGMDLPTSGEITVAGIDLCRCDDASLTRLRREKIGFVFQFFNLLPTLTVLENIALPLLLSGTPEVAAKKRALDLAERVGIARRAHHYPAQISGGEAQRAALARAVVHEPVLLVADEPSGSLDSANGSVVLDLMRELNRDLGVAILMATHDSNVAAAAGHILRMRDGLLVDGEVPA